MCQKEVEGARCLADSEADGLCPVAEKGPVLLPSNEMPVRIFQLAEKCGKDREEKDKGRLYLLITEVEALFRIHGIPEEEWPELLDKVLVLQDQANDVKPRRKKVRTGRRKGGFRPTGI